MTIKIFCIYHKEFPIFKSDVIEPIQTGCNFTDLDLKILKDNQGDNIADKNPYYGELTAWYWVWKNYLAKHPETEYVGFCHYRRFLDFQKKENNKSFKDFISIKEMINNMNKKYTYDNIFQYIKDYDIILPQKGILKNGTSIYQHFINSHTNGEIDKFITLIKENYPDYTKDMEEYLNDSSGYFCLNFLIKREYFEELMNWTFDLLFQMDEISDWAQYNEYKTQRTPAYLIERFINVWINYKHRTNGLKILERKSYMLCEKIIHIFPRIYIIKNESRTIYSFFGMKFSLKNK